MSNYYQTALEQAAEWFMQLFFDPMYHVESVIGKNDSITHSQTEASLSNLIEVHSIPDMDGTTTYMASEAIALVRRFLSKSCNYNISETGLLSFLPKLENENWMGLFKWQKFNVVLQ